MLIPAMLLAQPAGKKKIVGVWEVKMAPAGQSQSPLLSLAMYGSDGSFTTAGGYKALPAIPAVQEVATELGPGYGRWAATGDREFRLTFYSVMWKAGLGERIPASPGHVGFVGVGRRVHGTRPGGLFGCKLERRIQHHQRRERHKTRNTDSLCSSEQPAEKKQLVGVWEVKVSPVGQSQSPLLSLAMYGGDGSFTTGGGYKALPPVSRGSGRCDRARPRVRPLGRHERQESSG